MLTSPLVTFCHALSRLCVQVLSDLSSIVLNAAFTNYNACVFAYGQTGASKTFSMMGWEGNAGLMPRRVGVPNCGHSPVI